MTDICDLPIELYQLLIQFTEDEYKFDVYRKLVIYLNPEPLWLKWAINLLLIYWGRQLLSM